MAGWLLALAVFSSGCDPGETLHYSNKTGELLFVGVNEAGRDRLPPGTTRNLGYPTNVFGDADDPLTIVIAGERGCIVLRVDTTVREFREAQDLTLVINPSDLPAREERTDCDPSRVD